MRFPFLVCRSPPPLGLLPVLLLRCLPTVMMKSPLRVSHTVLLWFRVMVLLRFLFCTQVILTFSPSPPLLMFALNLPHRLAATANVLSGMINAIVLLFTPEIRRTLIFVIKALSLVSYAT
jgi:hypothetical protein